MRVCVDRFEWPNVKGELPRVLVRWKEARDLCSAAGKRLCFEEEWNFACEGEAMRPYVTGFERAPDKCNYDKTYRPRTYDFETWDACQSVPDCLAALAAIDQRVAAGSMPACVSPEGVHDLNGNVNEWVAVRGAKGSLRAGIKGGWWGPVRNRCRPLVTFHGQSDFGYEVGFRCCRDAAGQASAKP